MIAVNVHATPFKTPAMALIMSYMTLHNSHTDVPTTELHLGMPVDRQKNMHIALGVNLLNHG